LIKDFQSFINEALALKKEGGSHYLERVETRLKGLDVVGFTDKKGERVDVNEDEKKRVQSFFREALSSIANPEISKIFKDASIDPGYIGLIRLGKPKVTLSSGQEVEPVFRVYERTDASTGKRILRAGKCFWLFTIGREVSTIKLYDVDGNSPAEKKWLIDKSIEHIMADRAAEVARISRVFSVKLDSKDALAKRHSVILTAGGISIISLDLSSNEDPSKQLEAFLKDSTARREEEVQLLPDPDRESTFTLETVPKQMNVTPDKVWILEKNEKFGVWGAIPITQSSMTKGLNGNEIQVKVGQKWLYWLDNPVFNTPKEITRVIRKGDKVALAKQLGGGDWLANIGTVTEIGTDIRSSEFPYVKTNGWDSSFVIDRENANNIFRDSRTANESLGQVLSFAQWSLMNS
jgi:hypothetical protein